MCHFGNLLASSLKKRTLMMLQLSHGSENVLHTGDLAVGNDNCEFERPRIIY